MTEGPEKRDDVGGESSPPARASVPSPSEDDPKPTAERRRLFERVVPELVKRVLERAIETGVEKLAEQPENIKNFVADLRLPKEVITDVYAQVDETKNGIYRVVAKEIRDVLEQTQFADEIAKLLTKLSFEIKTEIRFVPNERSSESREDDTKSDKRSVLPKPTITSEVTVHDTKERDRTADRGTHVKDERRK